MNEEYSKNIEANLLSPTAEPQLDTLYGILAEETSHYETATKLLTKKQEVLIAGKPNNLASLDQELLTLTRKTQQLSARRLELLTYLGLNKATLSDSIAQLPPPERPRFIGLKNRLTRAVHDANSLNRNNRDLLELSLRWIQDTVETIAEVLAPEGASYTVQGSKVNPKASGPSLGAGHSTINRSV